MLTKLLANKLQRYTTDEKGFTLVELLIVIAIIGVLAGVLLVALNPLEQFGRARDAGRINTTTQIGRAINQFFTSHSGTTFPSATWYTDLTTNSKEITTSIGLPATTGTQCSGAANNPQVMPNGGGTMCYKSTGTTEAVVWTPIESQSEIGKIVGGCAGPNIPVIAYFYSLGQAKVDCVAATTAPTNADAGLANP